MNEILLALNLIQIVLILFLCVYFGSWFHEIKSYVFLYWKKEKEPLAYPKKFASDIAKIYQEPVGKKIIIFTQEEYQKAKSRKTMWSADYVVVIDGDEATVVKDRYSHPGGQHVSICLGVPNGN